MDKQISSVSQKIKDTKAEINKLQSLSKTDSKVIILNNTLSHDEQLLHQLKNDQFWAYKSLVKAKNFEIIAEPNHPKFPVRPNKKLNIIIFGLIGIIAGILLAFLFEASKKD